MPVYPSSFETNSATVKCIIENINVDLEGEKANITAIITEGLTEGLEYYIQDSFTSYESIGWEDWQDSDQTKAEAPSQEYDIEDEY